jgi:hypothetical protein
MVQVYPTNMTKKQDNGDELYDLCIGIICCSCLCITILVSIIIFITLNIEEDSSQSY